MRAGDSCCASKISTAAAAGPSSRTRYTRIWLGSAWHGKRRGAASQPSDNLAIFNAGGVNYAPKIEGLYGMFEKATQEIERNKGVLLDKYIGDALVEAFD